MRKKSQTNKEKKVKFILADFTLANSNLLLGESLPRRCSVVEQASINVCAITLRQASTVDVLFMSKMKSGFFMKFTQNRRGRLKSRQKEQVLI